MKGSKPTRAEVTEDAGIRFLASLCAPAREPLLERLLIVVAHPDDDVIGLGACLPRLSHAVVLFVTDGAPRDMVDAKRLGFTSGGDYAAARAREAEAALAVAGVGPDRIDWLGVVDKEAVLRVPEITRSLIEGIRISQPEVIATHTYEGGHPDHDATALAVHLACRIVREAGAPAPPMVEFPSYHAADASGAIVRQCFLGGEPSQFEAFLTPSEVSLKQQMLACHRTQHEILEAFDSTSECFRLAPAYDFTAPPHPGRLLYETFGWDLDGERWREHATRALASFRVSGPL